MPDVENQRFAYLGPVFGGRINPVSVFPSWSKAEVEETEIILSLSPVPLLSF